MKIDGSTKRKVCVLFPLTTISTVSKQLAVLLCVLSENFTACKSIYSILNICRPIHTGFCNFFPFKNKS